MSMFDYSTTRETKIGDDKLIQKWQPKVGEWCWFWYHNTDVPNFMMFSHLTEDNLYVGNVCKGGADIEFDYCEPFIGELPSFIKG